jgi:GT2 family glycosyltransferase
LARQRAAENSSVIILLLLLPGASGESPSGAEAFGYNAVVHEGPGVSFVIPVKNGARWIKTVLEAVLAEADRHTIEVVIVDDGSSDGSLALIKPFEARGQVRIIQGANRGAACAINLGLRHARYPFVAQLDQDVRIDPDWLPLLLAELADPTVAAAQGHYIADPEAALWAQVMGLDLAQRYSRLGRFVNQVCTGNTLYRAEALARVGYFDEALGYGYDNDLSYRLSEAGYRLALCKEACSVHYWRDTMAGYLKQQYGMGYGRIDLVKKHRNHYYGDDVSDWRMMAHAPLMLLALLALAVGAPLLELGRPLALAGAATIALLACERALEGVGAWRRFGDPAGLLFPIVHLLRDVAWVAAIATWLGRRILLIRPQPAHSMTP